MAIQEQHEANYSSISPGGAVAAMYVNGVCVRSGVTERGEVRDQPGQVVGGQQGGNRNDLRRKCQEDEVYIKQLPQLFDQYKEFLETPLLTKIAELEEVNKQLYQKTVEQRGMLEDSVQEIRKLQKATKGVVKGAVRWETEALSLKENFLYQEEELVSLRDQVSRLQQSNNPSIQQSGPVPAAQPQIQGTPTGVARVEVNVVLVHNKAKAILHPCTRQGCAKEFSKTSHRADHWRSFHGDPKLLCPSCDRPFNAVSKLNTHKRETHGL